MMKGNLFFLYLNLYLKAYLWICEFLHMALCVRWCQSCSGRFRKVIFSRESWAGERRVCASSPRLLPHTSFSPWPDSPLAWRGTNARTTPILSCHFQNRGLAWKPTEHHLKGWNFTACVWLKQKWFVGDCGVFLNAMKKIKEIYAWVWNVFI